MSVFFFLIWAFQPQAETVVEPAKVVPYLDTLERFQEQVCYHHEKKYTEVPLKMGYYYHCKGGTVKTIVKIPVDNPYSFPCRYLVIGGRCFKSLPKVNN
jgi:hypothetical protein